MSSPILITGVAGFIGFHTARTLLACGHTVVGIDNLNDYYDPQLKRDRLAQIQDHPCFTFVQGDISDKAQMEKMWAAHGPFTRVIHLAAQAGVRYSLINPYTYVQTNCMGHLTVLEMCRMTPGFTHLVYASSSSVYGANTKMPFSIDDPVNDPVSLYAATKRSDELMSSSYARLYHLPQTGLRFFTVYGPWGRPDMSLYIFTKAMVEGAKVPVFNHGEMRRDFTYIDDIVDGIIKALMTPPPTGPDLVPHRVFNIGNNKSEKLMDLVRTIEAAVGKPADIEFKDMQAGDVKETYADITATTQTLGFAPTTPLSVGVPRFVEWYKAYYKVG